MGSGIRDLHQLFFFFEHTTEKERKKEKHTVESEKKIWPWPAIATACAGGLFHSISTSTSSRRRHWHGGLDWSAIRSQISDARVRAAACASRTAVRRAGRGRHRMVGGQFGRRCPVLGVGSDSIRHPGATDHRLQCCCCCYGGPGAAKHRVWWRSRRLNICW